VLSLRISRKLLIVQGLNPRKHYCRKKWERSPKWPREKHGIFWGKKPNIQIWFSPVKLLVFPQKFLGNPKHINLVFFCEFAYVSFKNFWQICFPREG
jgi:hypothetical protein